MKLKTMLYFVCLVTLSCDKDDKACEPADIKTNIIGDWSASYVSDPDQTFPVHFKDDGAYTEEGDLLLGVYYSPVAKWTVKNDALTISANYSNATTTTYTFSVVENQCDKIKLDIEGLDTIQLIRQ